MLSAVLFVSAVSVSSVLDSTVEQPERKLAWNQNLFRAGFSSQQNQLQRLISYLSFNIPGFSFGLGGNSGFGSCGNTFSNGFNSNSFNFRNNTFRRRYGRALKHNRSFPFNSSFNRRRFNQSSFNPFNPFSNPSNQFGSCGFNSFNSNQGFNTFNYNQYFGRSSNRLFNNNFGSTGFLGGSNCSCRPFAFNDEEDPEELKAKYGKGADTDVLASGGSALLIQLFVLLF